MNVITIQSTTELPELMRGYVCMNALEAAAYHAEHYGVVPEVVYQRTNSIGKTTIYIPVERTDE